MLDLYKEQRRAWVINPRTRVQDNKKKNKKKNRQKAKKEIKETNYEV